MFNLNKENIVFAKIFGGNPLSVLFLPNGRYDVLINNVNKVNNWNKCFFLDEVHPTVMLGTNRHLNVSGDILITCKEMGYDLSNKENFAELMNDKDKIIQEYNKLKNDNPQLFEKNQPKIDEIKKQYEQEQGLNEGSKQPQMKWGLPIGFFVILFAILSLFGGSSWDEAEIRNGTVHASCTVKHTWNADQIAHDALEIVYDLANKFDDQNSLKLRINVEYTNTYGEDKVVDIGVCSFKLNEVRRYSSKSNYKYNSLDDWNIYGNLSGCGVRF